MARVMIGEPSADVRELLVHMLTRLGHEPCLADEDCESEPEPDVLVVEPASPRYLELARAARRRAPGLPLVVCSIEPPTPATQALAPVRHLLKPFLTADLAAAVEQATLRSHGQ